uniref:BRK domain-containing protein n=1 Tax=Rhabditophanes sp. KR3021 TaxID=114890 RepID=A0AC35TPT7_9BILA
MFPYLVNFVTRLKKTAASLIERTLDGELKNTLKGIVSDVQRWDRGACEDLEMLVIDKGKNIEGNVYFNVKGGIKSLFLLKPHAMEFKDLCAEAYRHLHPQQGKWQMDKEFNYSHWKNLKDAESLLAAYKNEVGFKEYDGKVESPPYNYYFTELDSCKSLNEAIDGARIPPTLLSFGDAFYHGSSKSSLFDGGNVHERNQKKIPTDYSHWKNLKDAESLLAAYKNEVGSEEYDGKVESPPYNYYFTELDSCKCFYHGSSKSSLFDGGNVHVRVKSEFRPYSINKACPKTLIINQFKDTGECQNASPGESFGYLNVLTKKQRKLLAEAVVQDLIDNGQWKNKSNLPVEDQDSDSDDELDSELLASLQRREKIRNYEVACYDANKEKLATAREERKELAESAKNKNAEELNDIESMP